MADTTSKTRPNMLYNPGNATDPQFHWTKDEREYEWGLDFETYSAADLFEVGIDNYFRDYTTTVLMAGLYTRKPSGAQEVMFDFISNPESKISLEQIVTNSHLDAHNAMFEELCLEHMNIPHTPEQMRDTAVYARAAGAASSLEAAAPQILGIDKQEMGKVYIQIFSRPHTREEKIGGLVIPAYQAYDLTFNPQIIKDFPREWQKFKEYCLLDAKLGYLIKQKAEPYMLGKEQAFDTVTRKMNRTGWPVDMASVEQFADRYEKNLQRIEQDFRDQTDAHTLNLGSLPQLKAWCKDRGINAKSFDSASVDRMMNAIGRKLDSPGLSKEKHENYSDVHFMLWTKQQLGGSSLKKLKVIKELTAADRRLRDSYMHAGAGATMRTTGRGVQMQNLKRLDGSNIASIRPTVIDKMTNEDLANNMRQLFTSSDPNGELIVGDFSSVESRGLAWIAGAQWKLNAYAEGKDMYKVLASSPEMYGVAYDAVTKMQRQAGKVGELSCGYGAGPDAVESFAKGMGIDTIDAPALVRGWRNTNPEIVRLWAKLDEALHTAISTSMVVSVGIGPSGVGNYQVRIIPQAVPLSLGRQADRRKLDVQSLLIDVVDPNGVIFLRRIIHGVYEHGRGLRYFKPTSRKTGDLWTDTFTNPKTKQTQHYTIYGGKLSGLLTQSFCREIFMIALKDVSWWTGGTGPQLIGQFHDEIVLDWTPASRMTLQESMTRLETSMSMCNIPGFPLAAEIKHDYRYTK